MKQSRQADLCARDLLHVSPRDGVMYAPLLIQTGIAESLQLDVLLIKVTDYLRLDVDSGAASVLPALTKVRWLHDCATDSHPGACSALMAYHEHRRAARCASTRSRGQTPVTSATVQVMETARRNGVTIVDDLAAVANVSDRLRLRACLHDLCSATRGRVAMPTAIIAHNEADLAQGLRSHDHSEVDAWLIKPAVACGVHESHQMSLVFATARLAAAVRCSYCGACGSDSPLKRDCWLILMPVRWIFMRSPMR